MVSVLANTGNYRSKIIGLGQALPQNVVTNEEFAKKIDTSDEWIRTRTGIKQRYFASHDLGETTVSLGKQAAVAALADAKIDPDEIDLVILATSTPDHSFPAGAVEIQGALNIKNGSGFDLQSACCGFLYAIIVANGMIRSGTAKNILVIGAETMSRILDMNDRSTCVLFGDGAGAVVLRAEQYNSADHQGETQAGILATKWLSLPNMKDDLYVDGGVSTSGTAGKIIMQGSKIFRIVTDKGPALIEDCLQEANISVDDIDWFVPHQANNRILTAISDKIGLPREKLISTVDMHANTSTASIPLALHHAINEGKIKPGNTLLLAAFGGGLTMGAAVVKV